MKSGFSYPWAGTVVGTKKGQPPFDISPYKMLSFSFKGYPGTYRLMSFHDGMMGIPPVQEFTVKNEWQTIHVQIDKFQGFDSHNFTGFSFVAGPTVGAFEFQLRNVKLEK